VNSVRLRGSGGSIGAPPITPHAQGASHPVLLTALLALLLSLATPVQSEEAGTEPQGQRLVSATGVSGRAANALELVLARYTLAPEADEADEERELRRAERAAIEALATEGYYSPRLRFEPNPSGPPRYRLVVDTGPLTHVTAVELEFRGAVTEPAFADRAAVLRSGWTLPVGAVFRSADWEAAKAKLLQAVTARDFAAAIITSSSADVDASTASAVLKVELDSGPAFRVGPIQITGLQKYPANLVERFNPFKRGDPYDRAQLVEFQQSLQETPFFSSVVATLETDPATAADAPLKVEVREARTKRVGVGVGFSTNTGAHLEAVYRQTLLFGRPYSMQSGFRIDQTGEYVFADLIFPPHPGGVRDSVGALYENSDIENLQVNRWGLGAARSKLTGPRDGRNVETQWSVNFEHERRKTPLDPAITLDVLSTSYTWKRRDVDDITLPRRGNLLELQGSVGAGGFAIEDAFARAFGSIVQFFPVGERDTLMLRAQVGGVLADSTNTVPNKFLFRTGGALTVRGYDYESLGVEQGGAIVGGRALAVATVEYVKWLRRWEGNWGVAAFVDAGDAAERFGDLDPALGYGLGVRWRTPAGPLAVDVAWGERFQQLRVHFSVAIAF
jgi:translocation and assembly module TamA